MDDGPTASGTDAPPAPVGDSLAAELARRIQAGELAPGDRLPPERDLMRRFGVSRSAVREAILRLAGRGLVHTRPGHRPVIRRPDYATAIETLGQLVGHGVEGEAGVWTLFETRIFLEAALARHAALHARPEDMDAMAAALEENRAAIGDPDRFYATDAAFHALLYRVPRNPIYPAVHRAYVEWLSEYWRRMPRAAEIDRVNHAGHAAVFAAIQRRDPDAAEAALRRHLATAWDLVRSTF